VMLRRSMRLCYEALVRLKVSQWMRRGIVHRAAAVVLAALAVGATRGAQAGLTPAATFHFACRDGNPHCDIDAACDGQCTVPICVTQRRVGPPKVSLCPTSPGPFDLQYIKAGHTYRGSRYWRSHSYTVFSNVIVRCLHKRRRCAPPPRTCTATFGDGSMFTCRAWLDMEKADNDPEGFGLLVFVLDQNGGEGFVQFDGLPTPGVYSFGNPGDPTDPYAIVPGAVSAVFTGASGQELGTDATGHNGMLRVQLDDIVPSTSVYHHVHGNLRAHLETATPPPVGTLDIDVRF
jgi:hypothetical protein